MSGIGSVGILNVGAGDTKLSFDKSNPAERIRAARIVRDMLRRGYALLVEVVQPDGSKAYQRALDFREDTAEYLIADFDASYAAATELPASALPPEGWKPRTGLDDGPELPGKSDEEAGEAAPAIPAKPSATPRPTRSRGRPRKAIPAESTRAVAVARTAGG